MSKQQAIADTVVPAPGWYGADPYTMDLTSSLKPGVNTIKVRITNTLANKHGDPKPSGLLGPVLLTPKHSNRVQLK